MKRWLGCFASAGLLVPALGCHSAFVQVTLTNTGPAVRTVEVDYPSQSFGVGRLAPGQVFHYRFQIQGSGPVKIEFTDVSGKTHDNTGPELTEGSEGALSITIAPDESVQWTPKLKSRSTR